MQDQNTSRRRKRAAEDIRRLLSPTVDLEALARTVSAYTHPAPDRASLAWSAINAVELDSLARVRAVTDRICSEIAPDLTLYVAGEGSTVYLRRWWLQREIGEDGTGLQRTLHPPVRRERPGRVARPPLDIGISDGRNGSVRGLAPGHNPNHTGNRVHPAGPIPAPATPQRSGARTGPPRREYHRNRRTREELGFRNTERKDGGRHGRREPLPHDRIERTLKLPIRRQKPKAKPGKKRPCRSTPETVGANSSVC